VVGNIFKADSLGCFLDVVVLALCVGPTTTLPPNARKGRAHRALNWQSVLLQQHLGEHQQPLSPLLGVSRKLPRTCVRIVDLARTRLATATKDSETWSVGR